ncbi:transposase [Candidatus Berkelbacteria bacterium]|nr:transposase [Candidatus Berkelbacteria bacterium]
MAQYIVIPADIEPAVVCSLKGSKKPEWLLLAPEATRKVVVDDQEVKENYNPRVEFLNALTEADTLYAPLGGVGDALLIGAYQRGASVHRMTFLDINHFKEILEISDQLSPPAKLTKEGGRQVERCQSASAMAMLVHQGECSHFRPFEEVDVRISLIRVYINQLIATQDEIRKRLQQRTTRLERDQEYFLDSSASAIAAEHRVQLVEGKGPVDSLLEYEKELEREIKKQLGKLPVYTEVLEPVKGMGPRLAARIIAPIVDIRRFSKLAGFQKYTGWHVMQNGRPRAAQFIRGESAQFHQLLRQGIWLFGQQLVRSNSEFAWYYRKYKEERQEQLGTVVATTDKGKELTLTKVWLDARARRHAASKFLKYFWYAWWELHTGKQSTSPSGKRFWARDLREPERLYGEDW